MKSMADKAALAAATFYIYLCLCSLWSAGMIIITGNIHESSMTAKAASEQSWQQLNNQTLFYSAWCLSSSRKNLRLVENGRCIKELLNQDSYCQLNGRILHGRWHGTDASTSHSAVKCLQSAVFQHAASHWNAEHGGLWDSLPSVHCQIKQVRNIHLHMPLKTLHAFLTGTLGFLNTRDNSKIYCI